jgi:hypothetical protein
LIGNLKVLLLEGIIFSLALIETILPIPGVLISSLGFGFYSSRSLAI